MPTERCLCKFAYLSHAQFVHWYLVLNILTTTISDASIIRAKRATIFNDNLPIRTEYVDRNNQTILAMFNLTDAQKSRIATGSNMSIDHAATSRDNEYFRNVKEFRLNSIRNRLESALGRTEQLFHEMAAYPLCNAESNESSWLQENNVTMQFSHTFLDMKLDHNLDSAILRLYKVNPNGGTTTEPTTEKTINVEEQQQQQQQQQQTIKMNCAEPKLDSQIRVTVSIVQQFRRNKRAERKKRICNTIMMNVSKTGWVEIDISRAIYIWEDGQRHQQRQQARPAVLIGYLMIEVHDEEERPLKPGLYFKPPNCEQAVLAIPWNYYGSKSSLPSFEINDVPRYPRIDVKLTGFASFGAKNFNTKPSQQRLHDNLQLPIYNLSKNLENTNEQNESNTSNTPENHQLETSTKIELLTHFRNLHNFKQHHHQHQHHGHSQQQYDSAMQMSQDSDEFEQQQQHTRHHRRRQRRHHHNHQHLQEHQHPHPHHHHHNSEQKFANEHEHLQKLHHRVLHQQHTDSQ